MIHDHDRRFYIGGSDASKVLGNHNTKTYKEWWLSKLGISDHTSSDNQYTAAGTRYEHPILDCYAKHNGLEMNKDRQIILEDKMLRVNYDGDADGVIYEVKTHKHDLVKPFDPHSKYIDSQCQLQMYVWQETQEKFNGLIVLEYTLMPEDYENENPSVDDIDYSRITAHKIKYKPKTIKQFLNKLETMIPLLKEAKERSNETT